MNTLQLAERFIGLREIQGPQHEPQIVAFIQRSGGNWINDDETPWCSAFVYYIAWLLDLQRPMTKALRARSWLEIGTPVKLTDAKAGDVVILMRGGGHQPGPEVVDATGHVAFFVATEEGGKVMALGGNQSNAVTVAPYPADRVLGVRRLHI